MSQHVVLGMDEVGRGCWAGPVVVGAAILADPITGLRDSKLLSPRSRTNLAALIYTNAIAVATGEASSREIDELGLTGALSLAYRRALAGIAVPFDQIIIDGNFNFLAGVPQVDTVIKGDALVPSVSAASIIAKVARDQFMADMDQRYPGYGFAQHVGYGTAAHLAALKRLGVCELHRQSFAPIKQLGMSPVSC